MDIQKEREVFEKLPDNNAILHNSEFGFNEGINQYYHPNHAEHRLSYAFLMGAWLAWQAKAQAVPEGFILVKKEPYAYLIKHKLWNKNSQPEIYLADDFIGNDGVEKEKLTVCIPLYKGGDEAQE